MNWHLKNVQQLPHDARTAVRYALKSAGVEGLNLGYAMHSRLCDLQDTIAVGPIIELLEEHENTKCSVLFEKTIYVTIGVDESDPDKAYRLARNWAEEPGSQESLEEAYHEFPTSDFWKIADTDAVNKDCDWEAYSVVVYPHKEKTPCILVSCIEREIVVQQFDYVEDARVEMRKQYLAAGECDPDYCRIEDNYAYKSDANNHDNYDWQIFPLKGGDIND